ncbi:MAG: hypothetical protein ABSE99_00785 [Terracidiphilus sp.]|jgi:hypothetical protein
MNPPIPLKRQAARARLGACARSWLAVLAAALAITLAGAQTPSAPQTSAPAHKPAHPHKRPGAAHPGAAAAQAVSATAAPATPPKPVLPDWPVNDKPAAASVTWDSRGLRIDASNSSLQQILNDVAASTGAKVEGLSSDERIFGAYGPGQARDVLSQLLEGSGYNVLMIGDQGQGAPRQILLTARHAGDAQPAANNSQPGSSDDDADTDDQPQTPPPAPVRPGFAPGGPPRTPQQIEMEQRMQQQRAQQPPPQGNPPQN